MSARLGGAENQKAKGKRQKAKMKTLLLFIFAFCLLPFDFSGYYDIGTDR